MKRDTHMQQQEFTVNIDFETWRLRLLIYCQWTLPKYSNQ